MQRRGERVRKECEMRRGRRGRGAEDGFVAGACKWLLFVWVGGENGFVWCFLFMDLMPPTGAYAGRSAFVGVVGCRKRYKQLESAGDVEGLDDLAGATITHASSAVSFCCSALVSVDKSAV